MNARINIETTQDIDGAAERISLLTEGQYSRRSDSWVVSYIENSASGIEGTLTKIRVFADRLVIDREGPLTSHMEFYPGVSNRFPYRTEMGMSVIGIHTKSFTADFGEDGGRLSVRYMIDLDNVISLENKLEMSVGKI